MAGRVPNGLLFSALSYLEYLFALAVCIPFLQTRRFEASIVLGKNGRECNRRRCAVIGVKGARGGSSESSLIRTLSRAPKALSVSFFFFLNRIIIYKK